MIFASSYAQLRPAERDFVDRYISDLETASVRAGVRLSLVLGRPGIGDTSDRAQDFLERSLVRAAIAERVRDLTEQSELSAHRIVKEVKSLALSNMSDYWEFDEYGLPTFKHESLTPEQWSAVKSIEYEEKTTGGRKIKIVLHDKTANLAMMFKYMGLDQADNSHYRENNAKTVETVKALPANVSDDDAAAEYAKMIGT